MNRLFVVTILCLVVFSVAAEDGIIVRSAKVYSAASSGATQVGLVSAGTRVSIFSRQGGWKEIFSKEQDIVGWIRSYQVRTGNFAPAAEADNKPDSRGFLSGLAAFSRRASSFFSTGGQRTSSGTATLGVRGLSEQQIKSAQPDFEQLENMKRHVSDESRLKKFAGQGRLQSQQVEYIEPKFSAAPKQPVLNNK